MIKHNQLLNYLRNYRFKSILIKNFLTIIVLVILLISTIMGIVFYTMNGIIEDEVGMMSINSLYKTRDRIDVVLKDVVSISSQLSLDENVNHFLLSQESGYLRENIYKNVADTISIFTGVFSYIDSIYIYSSKREFIVSNLGSGTLQSFDDITWYEDYGKKRNEPAWTQIREKNNVYPYFISYVRPLKLSDNEPLGAIVINLDVKKMEKLVSNSVKETADNIIIVDTSGRIIFSTDHTLLMKMIQNIKFYKDIPLNRTELYKIIGDQKHEKMVSLVTSEHNYWKFIYVIPLSDYEEKLNMISNFLINLLIISIIIAVIIAAILSVQSYNPVKNILSLLNNPGQWNEKSACKINSRKDEIKDIAMNIIHTVYSNQQLKNEIKDYMNIMDKAQITALQAQINPHFLYNTLETIRWMAIRITKGDNQVSEAVLNLSELLRMSLDNSQQLVTIEEEVWNAKLYVNILMLRYEEKLNVIWKIDDSALKFKTIKICIQPIIENAVYHGIKPLRKAGEVCVEVCSDNGRILIIVSDNGIGMDKDKVNELNMFMKDRCQLNSEHIGIQNVNQRIKLVFGEEYGVFVSSEIHSGTTVTIRLPGLDIEREECQNRIPESYQDTYNI